MTVVPAPAFLLVGAAAGAVHFAALRHDADLTIRGRPCLAPIALRLLRSALTLLMLALAARFGVPSLLAATIGFVAARQIMLRRRREAS